MILSKVENNVEKSGDFEQTDFRIDGKYKNKVLWMLINQYRFKIRTPIQEIVSNARDAQRENGNPDRAIKIQLPTKIEPTFIVRDYGVGMDEHRIKTIFTSFGASTKNADNSQTGGFGIGAKSPLAYTSSFNIKTYVDGQYWFYVIAKTKNDGIGINLLSTGATTEENGTEIQIPVNSSDTKKFVQAACRCTMFWEVQPIFNLPDEDLYKVENGTFIADNVTIYNSEDLGIDYYNTLYDRRIILAVDGIPYELDYSTVSEIKALSTIENYLSNNTHCVIELNTGDIDLLQTRESIDDTEKTLIQLEKIGADTAKKIQTYIDNCFTDTTLKGRIAQYQDVESKFRDIGNHVFGAITITRNRMMLDKHINVLEYSYRSKARRGSTLSTPQRHTDVRDFLHNRLGNFYWDDIKDSESDIIKNRRMRNHLENTGQRVLLVRQSLASNYAYINTLRLLNAKKLSSLDKPVMVKGAKGAKKLLAPTQIDIHTIAGGYSYYNRISKTCRTITLKDTELKYVYVGYADKNYEDYMDSKYWVKILRDEYDVIPCRISQKGIKAIKDNPNFTHIEDFLKTFKPTEKIIEEVVFSKISSNMFSQIKIIVKNSKRISDKLLTRLAQRVIMNRENTISLPHNLKSMVLKDHGKIINNRVTLSKMLDARIGRMYPLLSDRNSRGQNINYINSKGRK